MDRVLQNKTFCIFCLIAFPCYAQAALVTNSSGFADPLVVNFADFSGAELFTGAATQVGSVVGEDVVYSSTENSFIGDPTPPAGYGFGANGSWDNSRVGFVGTNSEVATIRFDFNDGPVSDVGGFVNYNPELTSDFTIAAIASDNSTLESYNVSSLAPIATGGDLNSGEFRGISRATEDIAAFTISGAVGALDDLTFGRLAVAVPEPSFLAISCIVSCAAFGRGSFRKKQLATAAD